MVLCVLIINGNQKGLGLQGRNMNIFQCKNDINLFALGCFTEGNTDDIAQIGTALNSSVKFLETYERELEGFHNKYHKYRILIMIGLFLAYYKYLQIKRK